MTGIAFSVASVLIAGIASHVTHAYLKLRERERLSATDRAELEAKFVELAKWQNKVDNHIVNARR